MDNHQTKCIKTWIYQQTMEQVISSSSHFLNRSRWFLLFRLMIPLDFNHLLPGGSVWQMEVFDFSLWHWWHLGNPSLDGIETWNFPKKVRVSCRFCPWPQWPVTIFRRRFCSSAFFAVATVARKAELSKLCPEALLLFLSLDESWGDRFLWLHGLVLSHLCRRKHYTCWLVAWNIFFSPYVGNNHPNWLKFSDGWLNHQPAWWSWWSPEIKPVFLRKIMENCRAADDFPIKTR